MKTLTVKLDEALYAKVEAVARRRKTTRSAVIRDAVAAWIDPRNGRKVGSALDLAKDLVGCLSGPTDLSSNKAHLRGFGR